MLVGKSVSAKAILLTKRGDIREAVRQALKAQGVKADDVHSVTEARELFDKMENINYAMLILDWKYGVDKIMNILTQNRKKSRLESYPVFLISAPEDANIIAMAHEYFIHYIATGEVTTVIIRDQIKSLVKDFQNLSPMRKLLIGIEALKHAGDLVKATDMLERLHDQQPGNQRVALELAEILIHSDNWSKAEAILQKLINQEDCHARAKHLYARCRLKQGDYDAAITSLKGAQLISPYNIERLMEMGNLFLRLDKPEQAEATFDEVLDFAPDAKDAKIGKSTSKLLKGEINEALSLLNEFANPRELSAVFNTAAILAIRQKRFDAGHDLYQKATQVLAKKPKLLSRIFYNMGIGHVKAGKIEKGLQSFEKSLAADPEFADAKHNIKAIKHAAQHPPRSTGDDQPNLLFGLEESFVNAMPSMEVGENQEEEIQLEDVLAEISEIV